MKLRAVIVLLCIGAVAAWMLFERRARHGEGGASGQPLNVKIVGDIAYGEDEAQKLDLYLPAGSQGFPTVIFVHGGSWITGDKTELRNVAERFAADGIGFAVINYRLSPGVKHPAHAQDAAKAFAWMHRHVAEYGGRADSVFLSGHSSGGHIVALLGTDESLLKAQNLSFKDLDGVIPIGGEYLIKPGRWPEVFGDDEATCRDASPLSQIKGPCPPFLVLCADGDGNSVRQRSSELVGSLKSMKGEAELMEVKDRTHAGIIRQLGVRDDPAARMIIAFVRQHSPH